MLGPIKALMLSACPEAEHDCCPVWGTQGSNPAVPQGLKRTKGRSGKGGSGRLGF